MKISNENLQQVLTVEITRLESYAIILALTNARNRIGNLIGVSIEDLIAKISKHSSK